MTRLRMRDLESSGVPRSSIHFYLREGVLPPGQKTAPNAALYGDEHLEILRAIKRLREEPLGPLPLPLLRRVIELFRQGVELELAVALERAVLGGVNATPGAASYTVTSLAVEAGVGRDFVRQLLEVGLLVPAPSPKRRFDSTDLRLVQLCRSLTEETSLPLEVGRRISEAIRDLSTYEMSLRNRVVEGLAPKAAARASLRIQEGINALHAYLFYRWRLHDIAALPKQGR